MADEKEKIELIMALRQAGVKNQNLLEVMESIPRENFVPKSLRHLAYANEALPINHGQTISQPLIVAHMTAMLQLNDRVKVLEVGTGSGYQAAILSRLCRRVYTLERDRNLMKQAEARFAALHLRNVTTVLGDGYRGWSAQAPFDRIILTASVMTVPAILLEQMAIGGVMVLPVGPPDGRQVLRRITLNDDGFQSENMMEVRFAPMQNGLARDSE